eukprot:TRINITY_DN17975_c0_g1_i1.p1 TRINITY_DN17975_c0_g1~~TRINITY_DN17975_c0_g1_i1.p1  ORF type:complete len:703 (+),score=200.95 TRINITY_DN17975_c0_g1_i1:63-2171(+)
MPIQDDCAQRFTDVETALVSAEAQWTNLEARLAGADTDFLHSRLDSWRQWFSLDEEALDIWTEGGLRSTIRGRIRSLVVGPLEEKLRQRVHFTYPARDEDEETEVAELLRAEKRCAVVTALSLYLDRQIRPIFNSAKKEDEALAKKIRKTERDERNQGVMALSGDTRKVAALKRQRPQIWEASVQILDFAGPLATKTTAFFEDNVSSEMVEQLVGSVPAVVSRALCDYHFERCVVELEQLEQWWDNVSQTLRAQESVWEALNESEGYLLRRIEQGLDDLRTRRQRYAMYATFGGSEIEVMKWMTAPSVATISAGAATNSANAALGAAAAAGCAPGLVMTAKLEESVKLLASVVADMQRRLGAIRNSALWRVIELAQGIFQEQRASEFANRMNVQPWTVISAEEGAWVLAEALQLGGLDGEAEAADEDVEAAAIEVIGRLERLLAALRDVSTMLLRLQPAAQAAEAREVLDAAAAGVESLNEDLLVVLDDPSEATAGAWLASWESTLGRDAGAAGQKLGGAFAALQLPTDGALRDAEARRERRRGLALARGLVELLGPDGLLRARTVAPLGGCPAWHPAAGVGAPSPPRSLAPSPTPDDAGEDDSGAAIMALTRPPSARKVDVRKASTYAYRPPERAESKDGMTPRVEPSLPSEADGPSCRFVDGQLRALRPTSAGPLPPLSPHSPAGKGSRPTPGGGGGARS